MTTTKQSLMCSIVEKIDDVLLHEREQLGLYELFIDVNKPLKINEMFVGR